MERGGWILGMGRLVFGEEIRATLRAHAPIVILP